MHHSSSSSHSGCSASSRAPEHERPRRAPPQWRRPANRRRSSKEKLEQLAYKFERKSVLREGYLNEMIQVLSDPRYGSNLNQVGASVKKHLKYF